jgi:hypothetical protein
MLITDMAFAHRRPSSESNRARRSDDRVPRLTLISRSISNSRV